MAQCSLRRGPRADGRDRAASPQSAAVRDAARRRRGVRPAGAAPLRHCGSFDCPRCGVTVERVPWADGKHQLSTARLPHQLGPGVPVGRRSRGSQPLAAREPVPHARLPDRKRLLWKHRRKPCSGSSAGSDGSGPPRSLSSAATCGRRISKSSPRRPGMPSTSWTGFTSLSTNAIVRSAAPSARSGSADDSRSSRRRAGPPETQGESDTRAARPLARAPPTQPAGGPRHAAAGMVRPLLALPVGRLGRGLPGRVVRPSHALAHRPVARIDRILNWFRARGEISAAIVEGFNNKADHQKGVRLCSYRWETLYHTLGRRSQKLPTD